MDDTAVEDAPDTRLDRVPIDDTVLVRDAWREVDVAVPAMLLTRDLAVPAMLLGRDAAGGACEKDGIGDRARELLDRAELIVPIVFASAALEG